MIIRCGFVSNSSSGSFIFPNTYTEDSIRVELDKVIKFAGDIGENYNYDDIFGDPYEIKRYFIEYYLRHFPEADEEGINGLERMYKGRIVVDTAGENSVPYWIHNLLTNKFGATYIHHG